MSECRRSSKASHVITSDASMTRKLTSSSSSTVYNALVTIRTKLIKGSDGILKLTAMGAFELLLDLVQRPNSKIVDISLSILGNCCLDWQARYEIRKLGGISAAVRVMSCLDSPSILNRACRLLGNLALDVDGVDTIYHQGGLPHVTRFLANSEDTNALLTALRTLRLLADSDDHRDALARSGSVKAVASLLTSKEDAVLQAALRTLAAATVHCSVECAQQVQEAKGIEELVQLASSTTASSREGALHVISNLSTKSNVRALLGAAGAVKVLVASASSLKESSSEWRWAVTSLCLFCRDCVNRVKIRKGGGLPILLSMTGKSYSSSVRRHVVETFIHFLYDEHSFVTLVEHGLVAALTALLQEEADKLSETHDVVPHVALNDASPSRQSIPSTKKKAMSSSSLEVEDSSSKGVASWLYSSRPTFCISSPSYQAVCAESDQGRRCRRRQSGAWSPESGLSLTLSPDCSPVSSPGLQSSSVCSSPRPDSPGGNASIASSSSAFCYSPICVVTSEESEDEDEAVDVEDDALELPVPTSQPSSKETDSFEAVKKLNESNQEDVLVAQILVLLSRLSQMDTQVMALMTKATLASLFDYVSRATKPLSRAGRILDRLTRDLHCFEKLVGFRVVTTCMALQNLQHHPDECSHCHRKSKLADMLLSNLSLAAESPSGMGDLAHALAVGTREEKVGAAVTAAVVLRSKQLRQRVFLLSQGLQVLLDELRDPDGESFAEVVSGVSRFTADLLGKLDHKARREPGTNVDQLHCRYDPANEERDLVLVTDQGGRVSVNRDRLSSASTVFAAMLSGGFAEARQSHVHLTDVTKESLEYIVHHLYGCDSCPCKAGASLSTLLDTLRYADQLLLPQLVRAIADAITARDLSNDDAIRVYCDAKRFGCPELVTLALRTVLAEDCSSLVTNVASLVRCQLGQHAIEDVRDVIADAIHGDNCC